MNKLNKGESCTYKIKATCGAPTVEPVMIDWSTNTNNWNITWTEFEKESEENFETRQMLSQYLDGIDLNQEYIENDLVNSKFLYPMHD